VLYDVKCRRQGFYVALPANTRTGYCNCSASTMITPFYRVHLFKSECPACLAALAPACKTRHWLRRFGYAAVSSIRTIERSTLSTLFDIIVSEIGNNLLRRYDYKTTTDICKIVEEPVRENIAASLHSTWTDDTALRVTMKAGMLTTRPKMI
jgi:hypothetical protein